MENNEIKNDGEKTLNFLEEIIENDLKSGKYQSILTRFPPEPNGYLHIGHAKSICLNFGLAQRYGGKTNLRFDDTNPVKEDVEYVNSIKEDINWLGFNWASEFYASDYFEQLYDWAVDLIKKDLAYVDDQTQEEIRATRGTITTAGTNSPYRNRSVEENLDLFARMRAGEFADGAKVLRAKIDMSHPNMLMRDPIMYRIIHAEHHRTGNAWCIYPMYDYAHGECDSIENITHSICTLEFDVHRPLYDWFIEKLEIFPSHQYEFARLNLTYTVMSKRKLLELVQNKYVCGWDDPRMPTISGLRRRGYTPESIRMFAEKVGVAKRDNVIDLSLLEWCLREDLKLSTTRVCAILNPVKLVITNYPEGQTETLTVENNQDNDELGTREMIFGRELYIDCDDYMENAPKSFYRLSEGREVRLKGAYIVTCTGSKKDENGNVIEVYCELIEGTKSGEEGSKRKVKSTINWVEINSSVDAEIRLYDRLFTEEDPSSYEGDYHDLLNPDSLIVINNAKIENALASVKPLERFQFQKLGYFCVDKDNTPEKLIFNRTASLKDNWAKK